MKKAKICSFVVAFLVIFIVLPNLTSADTWCHDFNVNLKIGDSGSEVAALYAAMNKEGFETQDVNYAQEKAQNYFGEGLSSAVSGFQEKYADEILTPNGLENGNGFVGKYTRAKLNELYGCNAKPIVGGQCTYQKTKGICIITSIGQTGTVGFDFFSSVNKIFPSFFNPKNQQEDLTILAKNWSDQTKNSLKVGSQVNCDASLITVGTCTPVIFTFNSIISSTSNQPPTISEVSGPITLKVNEIGTWTVKASDPEKSILSYFVRWGDEVETGIYSPAQRSPFYNQAATFTHAYVSTGNHNPTFTVTDSGGLFDSASASVSVGNTTVTPFISYVQAKAEDKNIVHAGEQTAIYGSNLSGVTAIYLGSQIVSMDRTATTDSNLTFYAPSNLTSGTASIYVQTVDGKKSNSITVQTVASNTLPSITVLSPNGGESWQKGNTYAINWKTLNLPSNMNVRIELIKGDNFIQSWGPISSTEIKYNILFPNSLQTGSDYKIRVTSLDANNAADYKYFDDSDAPFSIVAANSAVSCSLSNSVSSVRYCDGKMTWTGTSNPAGYKIKWYGTKNGVQDENGGDFGQYTDFTWTDGPWPNNGAVGNYTRYAKLFDSNGNVVCTTNTVNLAITDCPVTVSLTSDYDSITAGQWVTLSYSSPGANNCRWITPLENNFTGNTSGSRAFSPNVATTYRIRCCNADKFDTSASSCVNNIVDATKTIEVNSVPACTYSISPVSNTVIHTAGKGSVFVATQNNCPWTASTNSGSWDWIGISSGSNSGTGSGVVSYYFLANNTANLRSGTLTIAGQTFTIKQLPQPITYASCFFSVSPPSVRYCDGQWTWTGTSQPTTGYKIRWYGTKNGIQDENGSEYSSPIDKTNFTWTDGPWPNNGAVGNYTRYFKAYDASDREVCVSNTLNLSITNCVSAAANTSASNQKAGILDSIWQTLKNIF